MTAEQKKIYARIMKEAADSAMAGLERIQVNAARTCWEQDNGFYLTHLHIESVKGWGVRVRVAIQFFWNEYDFLCYEFYDRPSYIYPDLTDEIHLPEVPMNAAALLEYESHPFADFERYFARLMKAAREQFDYYGRMRDLMHLQKALADRQCARAEQKLRLDLHRALVLITAGEYEAAFAILDHVIERAETSDLLDEANEIYSHTESREAWLAYVNRRIASGRRKLSARLKCLEKRSFAFE